ncbi:MAG TPA: hypothetical protein VF553_18640 [Pyrinomonadaceae bacterium]|jgi:hypothetical protein
MSRKQRKFFITLWLIAAILFTSANAQETRKSKPEPLMIQEQGSFAVGVTVVTAPPLLGQEAPALVERSDVLDN